MTTLRMILMIFFQLKYSFTILYNTSIFIYRGSMAHDWNESNQSRAMSNLNYWQWRRGQWGCGWGEALEFGSWTLWTWERRGGIRTCRIRGRPISGLWLWWRRRNLMVIPIEPNRAESWPWVWIARSAMFLKFWTYFNSTIFIRSITNWWWIASKD